MKIIEVDQLTFSYSSEMANFPVIRDISFSIHAGEFVAIQGPSGSGKSTLLYLLGLLSRPTSGKIKFNKRVIDELSENEVALLRNQSIGFVFQHFHLLPKTTVLENILLPTMYSSDHSSKDKNIEEAKNLADKVGLTKHLTHFPNQLSGGQQQRVAICRALMNHPDLILADEPTGNLDSIAAEQILQLLKTLNRAFNKTVIIITHDDQVAAKCDRIIKIKDGKIASDTTLSAVQNIFEDRQVKDLKTPKSKTWKEFVKNNFSSALRNLNRNKIRTALTMMGVSIGISAVLSMMTLGQFTKEKILAGYQDLGVNTMIFYGYPNWDQKATDIVPTPFRFFDWDKDLVSLKKIFPQIERLSPLLMGWEGAVSYGGKSIEQDIRVVGTSEEGLSMSRRSLFLGRNFSLAEVEQKSAVCIIGNEIAKRLFSDTHPLGQVLRVSLGDNSFGCRVVGVLSAMSSNKEYLKPNLQVYVPFTVYQSLAGDWWSSQIKEVMIQLQMGSDVEKTGKGIQVFFEQRYGSSGWFRVDSDSLLVIQMRRFLTLFTVLLSSIAFVTLTVGGIGITNMMLVSVSERLREIGLRKALGATQVEIRNQFLFESIIVCAVAGFVGLLLGFFGYHLAIWSATKFVAKLQFEWTFDAVAFFFSVFSILVVGLLSGIFPAMKAEKLQVIDALRSE